jgi:hypothetical protein
VNAQIPEEVRDSLAVVPSSVEIKRVLFQLGPNKALGPDGLTAHFLQTNWDIMGEAVRAKIQ